jgi:transposase IS200 family protein
VLNEMIVGALGRAQRLYQVTCHLVVFVSNHFHALLSVDDAEQLAQFMNYVNAKIAREVADLVDWPDKVWARRYQSIPVSNEEKAQVARLRYGLSHGVKEGLVGKAAEWPGVNCVRAILEDQPLKGRPGRAQATSAHPPQPTEEIASAALPRGDPGDAQGVLADVRRFRSRLP